MEDTTREELDEFFGDDNNRGVATCAELAQMLEVDEQQLRKEGRARELRRVGGVFIWSQTDVDELLDDWDGDEEEEEEEDDAGEADEDFDE